MSHVNDLIAENQPVAFGQFHYNLDTSRIGQMVTTHQELILADGHGCIIEVAPFQQAAALHVEHVSLAYRLANKLVGRGYYQFHGIVRCLLHRVLRRLTVGQQTAHGNNGKYADSQTEQTRDGGGHDVHGLARRFLVESTDNQVWRCTDKRADTTHARCITQGDEQFGG